MRFFVEGAFERGYIPRTVESQVSQAVVESQVSQVVVEELQLINVTRVVEEWLVVNIQH